MINCQLWHWPWWVKAIWCWSMKICQPTLTISGNLSRLAGGGRWLPQVLLHTRQRQFPPWQDVATALSSGHNIHSRIKHQQPLFAKSSSDVFIWSYIIIIAFKRQLCIIFFRYTHHVIWRRVDPPNPGFSLCYRWQTWSWHTLPLVCAFTAMWPTYYCKIKTQADWSEDATLPPSWCGS